MHSPSTTFIESEFTAAGVRIWGLSGPFNALDPDEAARVKAIAAHQAVIARSPGPGHGDADADEDRHGELIRSRMRSRTSWSAYPVIDYNTAATAQSGASLNRLAA